MKLKFKQQGFQAEAVMSVADCFVGQPFTSGINYRIDPGRDVEATGQVRMDPEVAGFKNNDILLPPEVLLHNIHVVQQRQGLPLSGSLKSTAVCPVNLEIPSVASEPPISGSDLERVASRILLRESKQRLHATPGRH